MNEENKRYIYRIELSKRQFDRMHKALDFELRFVAGDLESTILPLCTAAWKRSASGKAARDHEPHLPDVDIRLVEDVARSQLKLLRTASLDLTGPDLDLRSLEDYDANFRTLDTMAEIVRRCGSGKGRMAVRMDSAALGACSNSCEVKARAICGQLGTEMDMLVCNSLHAAAKLNGKEDKRLHDRYGFGSLGRKILDHLRTLCWNLDGGAYWGVKYSDESDLVWDLYTHFRHELWLERPLKVREEFGGGVFEESGHHFCESEGSPVIKRLGEAGSEPEGFVELLK